MCVGHGCEFFARSRGKDRPRDCCAMYLTESLFWIAPTNYEFMSLAIRSLSLGSSVAQPLPDD